VLSKENIAMVEQLNDSATDIEMAGTEWNHLQNPQIEVMSAGR